MTHDELVKLLGVWLQIGMEAHRSDEKRGCCTCGFCVWSPEHAMLMALRERPEIPALISQAVSEARLGVWRKVENIICEFGKDAIPILGEVAGESVHVLEAALRQPAEKGAING